MDSAVAFFCQKNLNNDSDESSDSSESEVVIFQAVGDTASDAVISKKKKTTIRQSCFRDMDFEDCSDKEFQEDFRMTREAYIWLRSQIEDKLKNLTVGPDTIVPKKQVLATIWLLATPDNYRSVAKKFGMPRSTLHKCVRRVIKQITALAPNLIRWPSPEERQNIKRQNFRWGNIPGVVGAIDGTFMPIKAPLENAHAYNNRKCFHSVTLQAICDDKRLIDVFAGYPSSVEDARILRNSNFYKAVIANENMFFSENEIILGDKAYPTLKWCIPPYINRGNLRLRETNFNTKHAKTRQVIERTFALLFGRFRRLKYLDMSRIDLIPDVILACCVLHNICPMFPDEFLENYEEEGQAFVLADEEHHVVEEVDALRRERLRLRDEIAVALLN